MSPTLANTFMYYVNFYQKFAARAWANMTPAQYGVVLISVALFGWVLMKSGSRR